ncbi:unnamed protein product [Auanema sp. JU1783]|nr:unnamed protein product [Auanema sp. JU1783]
MTSWLRRRFSHYDSILDPCPTDDDPDVMLRGYRSRVDLTSPSSSEKSNNYDNLDDDRSNDEYRVVRTTTTTTMPTMSSEENRKSTSPMENSLALSEDSSTNTLTERETTPTSSNPMMTYTPVLRRKRSNHLQRRNYRIIAPDESLMILQQQNQQQSEVIGSKKSKILRRRSTRKESTSSVYNPPMVITPPVLLARTQSCSLCRREKSQLYTTDEMSPTSLTSNRSPDEDAARLSFVSSSTGYSSARSSLRSSDGTDENSNRDSGIASCSTSLSSSRRSALLNRGSLSQLDRIAIELLDTERSYVHDLHDVIQGYLNFLVDRREDLHITLDDISSLFGCIERIYSFNSRLYHQLDSAELDCVKMSRCFVESSGKFEDYISYCTNYHRMLGTLTNLQQQPQLSSALLDRQNALGHALPLSAYLLKPVQRILKYHLFLENMMKNLPNSLSADDKAVIRKAHEVMTSQAGRINDEKKKAEHSERVSQLQSAIQKWKLDETSNLSTYGDLLLESSFKLAGSKTVRLLFLFEEMLLIVKQRNNSYVCKDYIMSSNLMLNESICAEDPLAFQVLSFDNPRTQYVFLANSMEQKRIWMTELKRMMLDHYGIAIPEKTKQLMLSMDNTQKVAFGRPEFADVSIKQSKKVPKYLEKRRKSMDSQESRRRSLSATRLLGSSKSSLISESIPYRSSVEENTKCTCHLNPSTSTNTPTEKEQRPSVMRTSSASTIHCFDMPAETSPKEPSDVQTSRSRYHQARNRRNLPPRHDAPYRSNSTRRLDEDGLEATFEELYKELIAYGNEQVNKLPESEQTNRRMDSLTWRGEAVSPEVHMARQLRSKSLTRLDESRELPDKAVERRYSKLDQIKRSKHRKAIIEEVPSLRLSCGRFSLTDQTSHITERNISGLPPFPFKYDDEKLNKRQSLSARQRTPLTAEQVAELDAFLPTVGVVKSMIKSFEKH